MVPTVFCLETFVQNSQVSLRVFLLALWVCTLSFAIRRPNHTRRQRKSRRNEIEKRGCFHAWRKSGQHSDLYSFYNTVNRGNLSRTISIWRKSDQFGAERERSHGIYKRKWQRFSQSPGLVHFCHSLVHLDQTRSEPDLKGNVSDVLFVKWDREQDSVVSFSVIDEKTFWVPWFSSWLDLCVWKQLDFTKMKRNKNRQNVNKSL